MDCNKCDTFGGSKTYDNQVLMPLNGKVVCIDWCIHQIVAALNAGGINTIACCCGHNKIPGIINLEDGRVLGVFKSQEEYNKYCLIIGTLGLDPTIVTEYDGSKWVSLEDYNKLRGNNK